MTEALKQKEEGEHANSLVLKITEKAARVERIAEETVDIVCDNSDNRLKETADVTSGLGPDSVIGPGPIPLVTQEHLQIMPEDMQSQ